MQGVGGALTRKDCFIKSLRVDLNFLKDKNMEEVIFIYFNNSKNK